MRLVTRTLMAALIALPLGFSPAQAQQSDAPMAMAEEAMDRLILALQLIIASIPQYELPEVLENGDIIIRRIQPEDPDDSNNDGVPEEEA